MGAAASVASPKAGKDDKAIPKLSAEKTEKLILDTLSYEDVRLFFQREFLRADANRDNELNYAEFVKFIKELNLNIRDAEIFSLQQELDQNGDHKINLQEILAKAPDLLKKMYETIEPSGYDWCKMQDENNNDFYYNKRTGETTWFMPDNFPEATLHKALLRKTRNIPTLVGWMEEQFKCSDFNGDGKLTPQEFRMFVGSLKLGLEEEVVEGMLRIMDTNADGVVVWEEAAGQIQAVLMRLYEENIPVSPKDWCTLEDSEGHSYYYNKRTGAAAWETPEGYVPDEKEAPPLVPAATTAAA